ncbi:light-inducible protein CPRF2-like isoform X1 [Juglans regia]|uniref:Light-inducible protein CPRF2-like isoform X1 n=2 Tax=Juglans regia TaxID=51240 RepID=A0A6P9ET74_JUGRE|nr:light-inducible protein CPRF2-like isoform X1 [Juglans regia]
MQHETKSKRINSRYKRTTKMRENLVRAMDTVFPVDELPDPFWPSAAGSSTAMNRSESEWALERFMEELSSSSSPAALATVSAAAAAAAASLPLPKIVASPATTVSPVGSSSSTSRRDEADDQVIDNPNHPQPLDRPYLTAPVDPDEYRALLQSKLHMACAVAAQRGSASKPEECGNVVESQLQGLKPSQPGSQAHDDKVTVAAEHNFPTAQSEADGGPLGIPESPLQRKSGVQIRQTTSGSSREDSDDDELEGDMETPGNNTDVKRARRMLSNRESARRSRSRKQAHMNELETQVSQLRAENSTLLERLSDMNQKYEQSGVDNRILKADIEALRANVKMAEETVKRLTNLPQMNLAMANMPSAGMPFACNPMNDNAALPILPNPNQYFHQPVPSVANATPHHQRLDSSFPSNPPIPLVGNPQKTIGGNRVAEMSSMQHTASVPQAQKHISADASSLGAMPSWDPELSHTVANNN